MAPNFPFSLPLLLTQIAFIAGGVYGISSGASNGWIAIVAALLLTMFLSMVQGESSTNPEHDAIMAEMCELSARAIHAAELNLSTNGRYQRQLDTLRRQQQELLRSVELGTDKLYRWKK